MLVCAFASQVPAMAGKGVKEKKAAPVTQASQGKNEAAPGSDPSSRDQLKKLMFGPTPEADEPPPCRPMDAVAPQVGCACVHPFLAEDPEGLPKGQRVFYQDSKVRAMGPSHHLVVSRSGWLFWLNGYHPVVHYLRPDRGGFWQLLLTTDMGRVDALTTDDGERLWAVGDRAIVTFGREIITHGRCGGQAAWMLEQVTPDSWQNPRPGRLFLFPAGGSVLSDQPVRRGFSPGLGERPAGLCGAHGLPHPRQVLT